MDPLPVPLSRRTVSLGLGLFLLLAAVAGLLSCGEPPAPSAPGQPAATPAPSLQAQGGLLGPTALVALPAVPRGAVCGAGRPWPDTRTGIHVFNDQLDVRYHPNWVTFAATYYDGTQKMTRSDADALRAVNPNFLILHYRLGIGLGYRAPDGSCQPTGDYLQIIEGDNWIAEWPGDGVVEASWFFPYASHDRVYMCDWGWYLMEVDDASWRAWWIDEILRQLRANDDDGLFADSVSIPNYLGGDRWDPPLPALDNAFEAAWAGRLDRWMDYVRGQFAGCYVLIPNAGSWVTGRDPTDYSHADGVMIEGFGYDAWVTFSADDWHLQLDRVLGLVNQGKIILAQSYENGTVEQRLFSLASYLLIKGTRTYINLELDLPPEWWPEYGIPIGTYVGNIPTALEDVYDASAGVYRRDYTNGFVLVNPAGAAVTVNLGGTYYLAQPSGGGFLPETGPLPPASWTVTYAPVTQVTLNSGTAAVLLISAP